MKMVFHLANNYNKGYCAVFTFCLSVVMVHGYVLSMPRSLFSVSKNYFHVTSDSTSTIPMAIGKIHPFGSMPTAVSICPPYLVLMWHPSKHMIGLHAVKKPLLHASNDIYNVLNTLPSRFKKKLLPGLLLLSS